MTRSTVIIQSAPESREAWINHCMATVEHWSEIGGATYRQLGDSEFFGPVPSWVTEKCRAWINPATNLARLLIAQRLLDKYNLVVWVDADVFVWAPESLPIPMGRGATFCRERWMERWPDGSLRFRENVSNYLCSFARGGEFLDRHIADVVSAIRDSPMQAKIGVGGTTLLTQGYSPGEFDLIPNVANFSPVLTDAVFCGAAGDIAAFEAGLSVPLAAANLCLSHAARPFQGKEPRLQAIPALLARLREFARPVWPSELITETRSNLR